MALVSIPEPVVWPTRCEMPDLSGLCPRNSVDFALNRMFNGGGPQNSTSYALVMNFIRVVDILVEDYEVARGYFQAALNTGDGSLPLPALILAVGHFENCITTALRAIHFGQRIRKDQFGPPSIPKRTSVLSNDVEKPIRDMRNAIEHLDEHVRENTRSKGDPVCLMAYSDRIELFGTTIKYEDLASWITDLHGLAVALAQYKELSDAVPNGT